MTINIFITGNNMMNKTPIAAGLALIMGISVVFAFDRVESIEDAPQNVLDMVAQKQAPKVDSNSGGKIVVSQAGIEADILLEEAPLILEPADVQGVAHDGANNGHRSLKLALEDMQKALEYLEREAELTHRAVALLEQKYRQ